MPGFRGTMEEWKAGTLHSGSTSGPVVRSQKQALAIAFSQQRKANTPTRKLLARVKGR